MPRYKLKDIYNLVLTNIFFTTYSTLSHYFFTSINYWDQKSIFWKVVLHVITHLQKYYLYIYIYIYMHLLYNIQYFIPLLLHINKLLGSKINILESGPPCNYTLTEILYIYIYIHIYMHLLNVSTS